MLTKMIIRNFKKLKDVEVELGKSVVLIGPNNSGKTTALQALALWDVGLRWWQAKRGGKPSPAKRPGVTINRKDLISIPIPSANLLWNGLHVRNVQKAHGTTQTKNVRIDVIVEGLTNGKTWSCGFEFDYLNEESLSCRPVRQEGFGDKSVENSLWTTIPDTIGDIKIAYLPPMSGLAANEPRVDVGRVNVLLGEGQTAQVLRNLCYRIKEAGKDWDDLCKTIYDLFRIKLNPPEYVQERGEIIMTYEEGNGPPLDLSCSGRGLQQVLLLLAHLYANPQTVLLLDEPDAHLEIIRQRQIYDLTNRVAEKQGSQVIAASHSEVVLNEAAAKGVVVAFVGKPHRLDGSTSQIRKALTKIGFEQYYQAEEKGWCLYLEGATDLAILKAFAQKLGHKAAEILEGPFVHYVANQPNKAKEHFYALVAAYPDFLGLAIFDHLDTTLQSSPALQQIMWRKREIENYLCMEESLIAYARRDLANDDLFGVAEAKRREDAMRENINKISDAQTILKQSKNWRDDIKASDEYLDPLFASFFKAIQLPNLLTKSDYHELAALVPNDKVDPEIYEKLDAIVEVSKRVSVRSED
jgi:ABC-type lipoprotein export system ATPase subunit